MLITTDSSTKFCHQYFHTSNSGTNYLMHFKLLFNATWDAPEARALELETEIQTKLLLPPLKVKSTTMAAKKSNARGNE